MKSVLLLFDIDGTLITGKGVPKKVMLSVLRNYYPHFKRGEEVHFSGMTDPQIIRELMRSNNHSVKSDDPLVNRILYDFYPRMYEEFSNGNKPELLPGIIKILQICRSHEQCYIGLVTGNSMEGARIKLQVINIYDYFPSGAFGCDNSDRNKLPPIAIKRLSAYYQKSFKKNNIWIIGDSVFDVKCAKNNGLKCLAVETGKTDAKELTQSGADIVLKDLSNVQSVLNIFGLN